MPVVVAQFFFVLIVLICFCVHMTISVLINIYVTKSDSHITRTLSSVAWLKT